MIILALWQICGVALTVVVMAGLRGVHKADMRRIAALDGHCSVIEARIERELNPPPPPSPKEIERQRQMVLAMQNASAANRQNAGLMAANQQAQFYHSQGMLGMGGLFGF